MRIMLGRRQLELLLEALRRYTRFKEAPEFPTELDKAWTGLGTFSEYKPCYSAGLMTYATTSNPGYATWWKLTPKGVSVVQAMLDEGYTYKDVESGKVCPETFIAEGRKYAFFDLQTGEFVT